LGRIATFEIQSFKDQMTALFSSITTARAPFSSLSAGWTFGAMLLATGFLAASSWVSVPMVPVPMTMQTFAVTVVGALFGWRLGALTILIWLGEAAMGLPVLAGGTGGLAPFMGPTAGYLMGFVAAAALTGFLAERGWTGKASVRAFAAMLLGNLLILAIGTAWLAGPIGLSLPTAVVAGAMPFVLGAVLKSALAAALLRAVPAPKL
jgi:biotin transport system substrate-specific component